MAEAHKKEDYDDAVEVAKSMRQLLFNSDVDRYLFTGPRVPPQIPDDVALDFQFSGILSEGYQCPELYALTASISSSGGTSASDDICGALIGSFIKTHLHHHHKVAKVLFHKCAEADMYKLQLKRQDLDNSANKLVQKYASCNDDYEKWGQAKTFVIRSLFGVLNEKATTGILTHLMMLAKLCFVMGHKFTAQSIAENLTTYICHTLFLRLHPNSKNQQNGVTLQEPLSALNSSGDLVMLRIFERMFVLLLIIYAEEHLQVCKMVKSAMLFDSWLVPSKLRTSIQAKVCNDIRDVCCKQAAKSIRRIALEEKQRREHQTNIAIYVGGRLIEMQGQAGRIREIVAHIAPSDTIFDTLNTSWTEFVGAPDFHTPFSREWNRRNWNLVTEEI